MFDHTHDPQAASWVACANGHAEFPIQNLPLGVLQDNERGGRIGIAIGEQVLDVLAAIQLGLLPGLTQDELAALSSSTLNAWMGLPQAARGNIRLALFDLLKDGAAARAHAATILRSAADCRMALPAAIGGYSDFYAGIHHATKVGLLFRPDCPLMPNYKHVPIAYHGRTSSISVSGAQVRRPRGQLRGDAGPRLALTERMDFELELAVWIGPGNELGDPVAIADAPAHIAGYGLFNDLSARDIQAWEYQPLGPFQGKNFASVVSPWVVTPDALLPFRRPAMARTEHDPIPMDYLLDDSDQRSGGLDIELEVYLSSRAMRDAGMAPARISRSHAKHLFWTPAQMVAQHTLGGCNLQSGDLLGSGTISTPDDEGNGSMIEISAGGTQPLALPSGEARTFLCDEDEVTLRAFCRREGGYSIGFGECRMRVVQAKTPA